VAVGGPSFAAISTRILIADDHQVTRAGLRLLWEKYPGADGVICVRPILPVREAQVLGLLLRGLRNKEIAVELTLGVKTVETYRGRLMKRFGCTSPANLVRHAIRLGLTVP
jgi:DNA-binding NarL/FixJ family response regulator